MTDFSNYMYSKYCTSCQNLKHQSEFRKKHNQCKKCETKKHQCRKQKYKQSHQFKTEEDYPVMARCGVCKKYKCSKYFLKNSNQMNGLSYQCRYHETMSRLSKRGLSNENLIDINHWETLLDRACFYCGSHEKIGIDRMDNEITYTEDNCISCCWTCNRMKNTMHYIDYIKHMKKSLEYIMDIDI